MADERSNYEEKYRAKLDEWKAEIDKLAAKARQSGADAKMDYQQQLEKLRGRREEAEQKLKQLRQSGDDAWADFKAGAEKAKAEMEQALEKALSHFR